MNIAKLTPRERTILFTATVIISIFLLKMVIIGPAIAVGRLIKEGIAHKERKLVKAKRLASSYKELEKEYSAYTAQTPGPVANDEEESARTISEIEGLSNKSSYHIINLKPGTPKSSGGYNVIPFEVNGDSRADELLRFIYEIESSGNILRISNLTINAPQGSSDTLKSSFIITRLLLRR